MAHTDKTAPVRIQVADGRRFLRDLGGQWSGMEFERRWHTRRGRYAARRALRLGHEPFPDQPRGRAKYCWY